MLQHSLLIFYRSFKRFKNSFFINLIGLSTGLASALLIYLWVADELAQDKFHANNERLYQVMEKQQVGEEVLVKYRTAGPVAQVLKEELPEIEYAVSVIQSSWFPKFILSATAGDKQKAVGQFVGKDYFNMFSFDLIQGDANQVLADKNAIVISDELAIKLFGTTDNILGKILSMQLSHINKTVTISGIFKAVPGNSSEEFDFLLTFDSFKDISPAVENWGNNGTNTYVVLKDGTDVELVDSKIAGLIDRNNPGSGRSLFLKLYADRYLYGKYENSVQAGGRIEYVRLFSIVAAFILIIACINFMNLSTAKATRRIKDVGIKKAIGASRRTLILQYLSESLLMAFLALAIATLLVELLLPQFNILSGKALALSFDSELIAFFLLVTVLTGLVSGSYPAFYLSGFNPAIVLKGNIHASVSELIARKGLVIFQYVVSIVLIVAVMVVYKQIEYIQNKNLGYNKENIIYIESEGKITENFETFLTELEQVPGIERTSSMFGNLIGGYSTTSGVVWQGKSPDEKTSFEIMNVNYNLLEMLDIELDAGRSFTRDFTGDSAKIIFNQAAIKIMDLTDPLGQVVQVWGQKLEIIGVVRNFHFQSLHETVKPLFIRLQPKNAPVIMAKISLGKEKEAIANVGQFYKTNYPGLAFDYTFLDQDYQALYSAEKQVATLSQGFAGLAILISSLGLFGLSAFTAERRIKEIGIRKVLGSTEMGIIYLLSGEFSKIVLIAIGLALPISYLLADNWLANFAFKIDLSWWFFASAGIAAILIAWLTVGFQALKAARISPVKSLRSE